MPASEVCPGGTRSPTSPAQIAGCSVGAIVANAMFALPAVSISAHHRASPAHLLGEVIATLGLVLVIFSLVRSHRATSRAGRRRRLHRRRLLVHELDELRQPGDHHRPNAIEHLRGDRAGLGTGLHGRPACRRCGRDRRDSRSVPGRHTGGSGRSGGAACRRRPIAGGCTQQTLIATRPERQAPCRRARPA